MRTLTVTAKGQITLRKDLLKLSFGTAAHAHSPLRNTGTRRPSV
jgi:hypothetical protein